MRVTRAPNPHWRSAADIKPKPYDLVTILMTNGSTLPGWWTGNVWDGRREIDSKKVEAWSYAYKPGR